MIAVKEIKPDAAVVSWYPAPCDLRGDVASGRLERGVVPY